MVPEHRICETNTNHGREIATFPPTPHLSFLGQHDHGMHNGCDDWKVAHISPGQAKMDKYMEMKDSY